MDAIYARQSIEKKDSLSMAGQIQLCRQQTGEETQIYEDKGYSGKNTNRPSFQRMMSDVAKGLIGKIVVYRLDRFSRSLTDFSRLWEVLQAHQVEFVSISESFDTTTPMGRAMLNIIMIFAQLERETTAERVRDNYYQRAALGAWPGGPAPYGFSLGRLPCADGKLMPALIANQQADLVCRIFFAYAEPEASLGSVARTLSAQGLSAPKRTTWDNVALSRLLHSPLYVMADQDVYFYYTAKGLQIANPLEAFDGLHAGMIVGKRNRTAGKYQDLAQQRFSLSNHFGVVSSALWLQCQYKLEQNRQIGNGGKGKHTWLSGLLKCANCGYSIKVNRDGEKYYLVCSGRSNLGLCDTSIQIDLRGMELAVAEEISRLLAQCPEVAPEQHLGDEETAAALSKLAQKAERLISALAESTALSMKYINLELSRIEGERQQVLSKQAKLHRKESCRPPGRLSFHELDFAGKKLVAAQLIQQINLAGDKADVIWKV